ncbi:MAG: hypothetical protein M1840_001242 [Geoglossum simile]|nr:MAG: hypothetical protein M1840_001242 [Geoglossum simile]
MNENQKGRAWGQIEKLTLCLSILDQTGAAPDWAKLELPSGRTLLGAQRIWREMRREVAEAKGTENGDTSQVDGTNTTEPGYDASPDKKAASAKADDESIPAKGKAARKPRAKSGATKPGRKRANGNPDAAGEDDEEPVTKKNKVFEDGNEVLVDIDSANKKEQAAVKKRISAGKKNPRTETRAQRTKNAGEKAVGGKKHNASAIAGGEQRSGTSSNATDGDTIVVGTADTIVVGTADTIVVSTADTIVVGITETPREQG